MGHTPSMTFPAMILYVIGSIVAFCCGWHFGRCHGYRAAMRQYGREMYQALTEAQKEPRP